MGAVRELDLDASHGSWMEHFPWTHVANADAPSTPKPALDMNLLRVLPPGRVREYVGDGNYGGHYAMPEETMLRIWAIAVEETRELLEGGWDL